MQRAAAIKLAIARARGKAITLRGRRHYIFPSPERLAELDRCEGLSAEKVLRLRGVAVASQRGLLDPERLRLLGEAGRSDRWRAPELAHERRMAGKKLARRRLAG